MSAWISAAVNASVVDAHLVDQPGEPLVVPELLPPMRSTPVEARIEPLTAFVATWTPLT